MSSSISSHNWGVPDEFSGKPIVKEQAAVTERVPLYQYHKKVSGFNCYYYDTRASVEKDKGSKDGIVCYVQNDRSNGAVPLYQFHKENTNLFYYTTNRLALGRDIFDGIVCYIFKEPGAGRRPLYEYEFRNSYGFLHFYCDTREIVEPDKGIRKGIVGYVY